MHQAMDRWSVNVLWTQVGPVCPCRWMAIDLPTSRCKNNSSGSPRWNALFPCCRSASTPKTWSRGDVWRWRTMTYEGTEWNMHERGVQRLAPPGANRRLGLYSRQELTYWIIFTHSHFFPPSPLLCPFFHSTLCSYFSSILGITSSATLSII